ncbi:MAG: CHASE3 domain-containing protein, partial [Usitatibacteraceae bacterium]
MTTSVKLLGEFVGAMANIATPCDGAACHRSGLPAGLYVGYRTEQHRAFGHNRARRVAYLEQTSRISPFADDAGLPARTATRFRLLFDWPSTAKKLREFKRTALAHSISCFRGNLRSDLRLSVRDAYAGGIVKTQRRVVASFSFALALIALGVAVAFNAFQQLEEARAARLNASAVLTAADNLLSKLRDAETGQRGFALTGDEAFLQPYEAVRGSIVGDLRGLRERTTSTSAQAHLDLLPTLVNDKLRELAEVIALRRNNDLPGVRQLVSSGRGKPLMDNIRAQFAAIDRIEEANLLEREAETASKLRGVFAVLVGGSVLALALALAFGFLMVRLAKQRARNQVHVETQRLLETEEDANRRLQLVNIDLQASEEKLAVTLNSIGDAVVTTDAGGRVTRLNPLAAKLTGWTQADAVGQPVDEIFRIINQQTREPAVVPVAQTLSDGTIHGLANHTVLIARDGSECPIADSCAPIRDRNGLVVGAVLVFRDVTDEETTRRLLREVQARSDFALKISQTGGWELNLADKTSHQTPEHARIFGYDDASMPWSYNIFIQHVQPEDRAEVDRIMQDGIANRAEWHLECRIRRADGELRWIRVASAPQPGDGAQSPRMSGIVQDITDRKQIDIDRAGFNLALERNNAELKLAKGAAETASLAKSD